MAIGMNPLEIFNLAPNGIRAGRILATGQDIGDANKAADVLPKGPAGGIQVPGAKQEVPLVQDALVLSDAMIKIFDGGKLKVGEARETDGKLDKSELPISNFDAVDLDHDGKLDQAEIYLMLLKAGPEKRKEMLDYLSKSGQEAAKLNNHIKWIARGVTAVDFASIIGVWVLRLAFNVFSLPISAIVSTVPPILAQFFGMKGIEHEVDKMNAVRGGIAHEFDTAIAAAK